MLKPICAEYNDVCARRITHKQRYIFFPGLFFIIFSYIGLFMVVWGIGVWVLY